MVRQGVDYKPIEYPPGWFADCRAIGEHILRARRFHVEQRAKARAVETKNRIKIASDNT